MGRSYRLGESRGRAEVEGIILAALTLHQPIPGKFCPSVTKSGTVSAPQMTPYTYSAWNKMDVIGLEVSIYFIGIFMWQRVIAGWQGTDRGVRIYGEDMRDCFRDGG